MLGLTLEKLFLVAVVAAVLVGPARLPGHARELASFVRRLRTLVEQARDDAERDLGPPLDGSGLDWRTYDPRRVVREALADEPAAGVDASWTADVLAQAAHVRPGQQFLVTGSAAHPRRVRIDALAPYDPRRLAARPAGPDQVT